MTLMRPPGEGGWGYPVGPPLRGAPGSPEHLGEDGRAA
jgi:hypothetical protein